MAELNYNRIARLCYLLNGRNVRESRSYSCGYNPHEMKVLSYTKSEGKRTIKFNRVYLINSELYVELDGKDIHIDLKTDKFTHEDSKKNAQKVFGKLIDATSVIYWTEKALKELVQDYIKQMQDTLTEVAFF